jgi:hypothetical protein
MIMITANGNVDEIACQIGGNQLQINRDHILPPGALSSEDWPSSTLELPDYPGDCANVTVASLETIGTLSLQESSLFSRARINECLRANFGGRVNRNAGY